MKAGTVESRVEIRKPTGITRALFRSGKLGGWAIYRDGKLVGWAVDKPAATLMGWGVSMEAVLNDADELRRNTAGNLEAAIATVMQQMAALYLFTQRVRFWRHLGSKGSLYTSKVPGGKR